MKRVPLFRFGLLAGSLCSFVFVASSLRAQPPGPVVAATCAVLDKSCSEIDPTFVLWSFNVSLSSTGAATLITCTGITTRKPLVQKKCNNESLYPPFDAVRPNLYTFPLFPCSVLLGTNAASNDDWVETISPSGEVTYKCEIGGNDAE